jgi:uncharacterized membrane protein YdjX (TVP38/TMEM64 family)
MSIGEAGGPASGFDAATFMMNPLARALLSPTRMPATHAMPTVNGTPDDRRGLRRKLVVRIGVLVVLLGAASLVAWRLGYFKLLGSGGLRRLMDRLHRVPWIGPLYVVGFAVVAALGIPLTPLVLLAGALFGLFEGAVVAWVGLGLGTSGAYWIARLVGGASVTRLLAGHEDIIAKLHGRRGFLTLLRLRAIPLIPSLLLDYAAGTAHMDYVAYVGATMLGSLTSTVIFVFLASHVATGLTTGTAHEALMWSVGAGVVLVTVSFAPAIVRRAAGRSKRDTGGGRRAAGEASDFSQRSR